MNYGEENPYCYFHPKQVIIGVCAHCLKERLLILATKQGHLSLHENKHHKTILSTKPFPKVFALGSFLHRLELRHRKSDAFYRDASTSNEDSFISIKFENNELASWDTGVGSRPSSDAFELPFNRQSSSGKETSIGKSVVEHGKSRMPLRWRKRIGHLFQLGRWKRSGKGSVGHMGSKAEVAKGRKGWMKALTKRRIME